MTTISLFENAPRVRKDFSKIPSVLGIANLIDIQKRSFERFLQLDKEPEARENLGLQAVFTSIFPIKDCYIRKVKVIKKPKFDVTALMEWHSDEGQDVGQNVAPAIPEETVAGSGGRL